MNSFNERERSFETRFAQDEERKFKANARRNYLAGLWAAGKLGIAGDSADAYAKALVAADFDNPGSDCVFAKIRNDLKNKEVVLSDHQIRRTLDEFMKRAVDELKG